MVYRIRCPSHVQYRSSTPYRRVVVDESFARAADADDVERHRIFPRNARAPPREPPTRAELPRIITDVVIRVRARSSPRSRVGTPERRRLAQHIAARDDVMPPPRTPASRERARRAPGGEGAAIGLAGCVGERCARARLWAAMSMDEQTGAAMI